MTTFTHRVTVDEITGAIAAWIDVDGMQSIYQPHSPNSLNMEPWASIEEAEAWAVQACADFAAQEVAAVAAEEAARAAEEAAAAAVQADRDRLVRIENMLTELLAK